MEGVADLALGQDPARFEVFLDLNGDALDEASDSTRDLLWRKVVDERPDLRQRALVALTRQQTTRSHDMLIGLAKTEHSWFHDDTVPLILDRAAEIDQDTLDEVLYFLAPQAVYRLLEQDSPVIRKTLSWLLETHRLDLWTQGGAGQAQAGYDLVQLAVEQLHVLAITGIEEEELRQCGNRVIEVLLAGGCSLERGTVMDVGSTAVACGSALHVACVQEDNEPTSGAIAVELLINHGADIDRVVTHRNAPRGAGLQALQRHPKMRARTLSRMAGITQARPGSPGRM